MKRKPSPRVSSVRATVAHLVGPGSVNVKGTRLAFAPLEGTSLRLDPKALQGLFCYGSIHMSQPALSVCLQEGVEIAWLTRNGARCRGRTSPVDPKGLSLRLLQHRALADPSRKLEIAREIVIEKIDSQARSTRHMSRHGRSSPKLVSRVAGTLRQAKQGALKANHPDTLRGHEGTASAAWFTIFADLLPSAFPFDRRSTRPPHNAVNAALSLGYTWLLRRAEARLAAAGFEAGLGALHDLRPGRPSLACDFIEPFRVPAVDRWVLRCLARGTLVASDFRKVPGGVHLAPGSFGKALTSWEQHAAAIDLSRSFDDLSKRLESWVRHRPGQEKEQPREG